MIREGWEKGWDRDYARLLRLFAAGRRFRLLARALRRDPKATVLDVPCYRAGVACVCCGSRDTVSEVYLHRGELQLGVTGCDACGAC